MRFIKKYGFLAVFVLLFPLFVSCSFEQDTITPRVDALETKLTADETSLKNKADKSYVDNELGKKAAQTEFTALSAKVNALTVPDLSIYAKKTDIPNLSNYYTQSQVDSIKNSLQSQIDVLKATCGSNSTPTPTPTPVGNSIPAGFTTGAIQLTNPIQYPQNSFGLNGQQCTLYFTPIKNNTGSLKQCYMICTLTTIYTASSNNVLVSSGFQFALGSSTLTNPSFGNKQFLPTNTNCTTAIFTSSVFSIAPGFDTSNLWSSILTEINYAPSSVVTPWNMSWQLIVLN